MAFDTNDKLNSDSSQQNLEEFGIWISKEPEEITDSLDNSPIEEEAADSFNFVEANSMPLDDSAEEPLNDIPETFIEENFEEPQFNAAAETQTENEEIDLSSEFGFEDDEPFKPSDELAEQDLGKTEFDSIDFEELDDTFDSSASIPNELGSDFTPSIDDIQDETFTQDQIAPSPDFDLEDATIEDATPTPIKAELPPLPDFDLASPVQDDDDFEFNDKLEDIDEEVEANLDSLDRDVDHSILDVDLDDDAGSFIEKNALNDDFAEETESEDVNSFEEIDVPVVTEESGKDFKQPENNNDAELDNIDEIIDEMPVELSALNYEEAKIEQTESDLQDFDANKNVDFECPNNCIETEEIDLPDFSEETNKAENTQDFENNEEKSQIPDMSDISMDGFADFDISAFENNDAPAPKAAGGETSVSLDDFLGGGGEDVSAQFGLSADGGFDVTDDFLAELNGEFGGGKEEKSDILDEASVDIELEFDDQYMDNIQADASERIEDTSNFDEFFGDDAASDAGISADNFDELFANVQDEIAGETGDFEQMFAEANGEKPASAAKTSETVFDEVTEFDDLLFSDDGPNIEAEKAHANKVNTQIDYNIMVAEEDVKITQVSQKIESDNGDDENIPIFGTTIDENGAKIAMQQPIPDNGIRGPALDNSEDDSFYESLFNDAEIYDESSSDSTARAVSEEDALFNELADLDIGIDTDTLQDKITDEESFSETDNSEKKTDLSEEISTDSAEEMSFEDLMPEENTDFAEEIQNEPESEQENLGENQNFDDNIEESNINSDVFSIEDDAQPMPEEEISENASEIAEISVEEAMEEQNQELNNTEGHKPDFSPAVMGLAAAGLGAAAFTAEKVFNGKKEEENADDELLTEDDLPVFDDIDDFNNSENEEIEKTELAENLEESEDSEISDSSEASTSIEQFDDFGEFPDSEPNENLTEPVNEAVIEDSAFDDVMADTDINDIEIEENAEFAEEYADESMNELSLPEEKNSDEITDLTEDSFETVLPDTAVTAGIADGIFDDVLNEEESAVDAELDEELPVIEHLEEELEETSEISDLSFDEENENAPLELTEDSFETTLPDTPVTAGLAENAVNNNLLDNTQESKYTESMEDEQNMNFDDISQTSEENAANAAPVNEGSVLSALSSESVLKQISNELSMLRNEISLLKTELAKTRESVKAESVVEEVAVEPVQEPVEESVIEDDLTVNEEIVSEEAPVEQADDTENVDDIIPESVPAASNGFFDNDSDDETIALSDDELGNILNCADFTEEYVDNTAEVEAEQEAIPESVAALHAEVDEAYSEEVSDPIIGDVQFEEEPFESVPDEIEVPKVDDLVSEPEAAAAEEDYFVDSTSDEVSSDSISDDKLAYLQEETGIEEASEPVNEEIAETVEEEPAVENEIEIPSFEEEPVVESEVTADEAVPEETAEISEIVEEEPAEEIVIDSDDEVTVEETEIEQPAEEAESEPVAENADNNEVSEESVINIDDEETENDELAEAGTFAEPEETPVETVFEGDQWDEPVAETSAEETADTESSETVEQPAEESVAVEETEPAEAENKESIYDKASAIADKEPMNTDLKDEIKSVLVYMDQLLENLPDEKIEEFAKSSYFETYKKLFKELGLS